MKKHTALRLLVAVTCLTACRAPLVVDENGWPIGFATRAPATTPAAGRPAAEAPARDPYAGIDPHATAMADPAAQPAAGTGTDSPLVGWNGDVIQGDGAPTQEPPRHGIEPEGTGRMRIIELYQSVLDERDALRDELEALTAALEGSQRERIELEEQVRTLQSRVLALEAAQETMQAENIDLAARLTTAQIRRLEAEKLLLETKIDGLRSRATEASADTMGNGS